MEDRPRIGVVAPYWSFWEDVVADDPRKHHQQLVARSVAIIGEYGEIVWTELADDLHSTLPAVDLVVVVVTMASPPQGIRTFLQTLPGVVVLVWAHHPSPHVNEPFTHESITLRGATVGASMLTASLTKAGIAHDVVVGDALSPLVGRSLRGAAAATLISHSRLSVIGEPLSGYDFVSPSSDELARLGVEIVAHSPEEFAERAASVPDEALRKLRAEIGDSWSAATTEAGTEVSMRYALALEAMLDTDGSRAGTLNCHVRSLRLDEERGGVAPCFALGRETTKGRPWTCTGDVNTSLAMLFVSSLGLPTMYHEMEAIDETTNEVILANSGEYDGRFSSTKPPEVVSNPWFPGGTPTPIVSFQVSPGPASVVAVSSVNGQLRVIVAEGRFTARNTERTGTMSAAFQFDEVSAALAWRDWVRAGAGHHACATNSHVREDLGVLCQYLGLELIVVGGRVHTDGVVGS